MAREAEHCIKDKMLNVEDSILLVKTIIVERQVGHCIRDERL